MSTDERDPPIKEQDYLYGIKVVDIGDYRVARGLTRRAHSSCSHRQMVYDQQERRIWCKDCERYVEPFDAFLKIVEHFNFQTETLERRENRITEAEKFQARTLAAKNLDEAWRKRKMVPACPHCSQGLFPEDFKNGIGTFLGRNYATALAAKRKKDRETKKP